MDIHELRRFNQLWRRDVKGLKNSGASRNDYECTSILQQLNATNRSTRLMQPSDNTGACKEKGFDVIVNTLSVSRNRHL